MNDKTPPGWYLGCDLDLDKYEALCNDWRCVQSYGDTNEEQEEKKIVSALLRTTYTHPKLGRPDFTQTRVCNLIRLLWGQARRRARSWPFGTLYSAFCVTFRAEHAPLPRICYYKGKSLGSDKSGCLEFHLIVYHNIL